MTINEQIVTGRKFRKLIDEASRLWLRISFWTKASDVEFDDGEDAETKFFTIKLVIENLKEAFQNFKESVQNSLGGCKIEQEGNDFFIVGADSVRKKLGEAKLRLIGTVNVGNPPYYGQDPLVFVGADYSTRTETTGASFTIPSDITSRDINKFVFMPTAFRCLASCGETEGLSAPTINTTVSLSISGNTISVRNIGGGSMKTNGGDGGDGKPSNIKCGWSTGGNLYYVGV